MNREPGVAVRCSSPNRQLALCPVWRQTHTRRPLASSGRGRLSRALAPQGLVNMVTGPGRSGRGFAPGLLLDDCWRPGPPHSGSSPLVRLPPGAGRRVATTRASALGPVGAAKALHLLALGSLPLWDRGDRRRIRPDAWSNRDRLSQVRAPRLHRQGPGKENWWKHNPRTERAQGDRRVQLLPLY